MASLSFFLRDKYSKNTTPIHYYINFSKHKRLRGSTYLKIKPKFWDVSKQKVKGVAEISDIKDDINLKLKTFDKFIFQKTTKAKPEDYDKIISTLKNEIKIFFGKKVVEKKLTIHPFISKFIEQSKNRIVERTGKRISIRTIQDYTRTVNLLVEFEKNEKYPITFETINNDFYYLFKGYLEKLNMAPNTVGKYIKIIKVFMNEAVEQKLTNNISHKRFLQPYEKSTQIYLNEDELNRIIDLDLTDEPILDNARDLFIIGAYTGLRVSDFNKLTRENIVTYKNFRIFRVEVSKTNTYLPIPIHPKIEKILIKYDGELPNRMKNQEINNALEKIGEKAKLNDIITIKRKRGKKEEVIKKFRYEMIKNHTARRSFCTNAFISGMPSDDIMALSGHTSEKTFKNYIKISADERAIKIAGNDFFQPN